MGWKASTLIINNPKTIDFTSFLKQLGFSKVKAIADKNFESVINPRGNKVYLGTYKNNLIICSQELSETFFKDESVSEIEKVLMEKFPESEICAITLNSVVNEWGYAILKNNEKIRFRAGSHETGTVFNEGEILPEEKQLFSQSKLDGKGNRIYELDGEEFTEDQVGENFVFEIVSRYFGERLDAADSDVFETNMLGFSYDNFTPGVDIIDDEDQDDQPIITSYIPTERRQGFTTTTALSALLIVIFIVLKFIKWSR